MTNSKYEKVNFKISKFRKIQITPLRKEHSPVFTQIHDLVKKHFPEQSSLSCFWKHFVVFVFKYNRGMMRATDPHTTLQIVSTCHNQLWDRSYFFCQFGFGRVLKSTKNQTTTHTPHEQAKEQREEKSSSNSKKSHNISLRSYLKPSQIRYTGLIL